MPYQLFKNLPISDVLNATYFFTLTPIRSFTFHTIY